MLFINANLDQDLGRVATLPDGSETVPSLAFQADGDTGLFRRELNTLSVTAGSAERMHVDHQGITVYGNVTTGNTVVGDHGVITTNLETEIVSSNLVPEANGTLDLGSMDMRWRDLYLSGNSVYLGNAVVSESEGNVSVSGPIVAPGVVVGNTIIQDTDGTSIVGNIEIANASVSGSVTATNFVGNIDAANIVEGTVDVARLPDASTSTQGVVQLTDSTSTTSSTIAATATAVKSLEDGKVSKSGDTMTGSLVGVTQLGVGTTSPQKTLDITSVGVPISRTLTSTSGYSAYSMYENTVSGSVGYIGVDGYGLMDSSPGHMTLASSSGKDIVVAPALAEKMRVTSDGKVGINTANPSTILELSRQVSSVGNEDLMIHFNNTYQTYFDWRLGPVLTSGPNAAFQLKGGANGTSLTPLLTVSGTGSLTVLGSVTQNSDDRLKFNESYITDATTTLQKLKPQTYLKVTDLGDQPTANTSVESGLIAQEVWYDAPELRHLITPSVDANIEALHNTPITSSTDPTIDPEYTDWGTSPAAFNYVGLVPYTIQAINEQQDTIQSLQSTIAAMEARLQALEHP